MCRCLYVSCDLLILRVVSPRFGVYVCTLSVNVSAIVQYASVLQFSFFCELSPFIGEYYLLSVSVVRMGACIA